MAVEEQVEQPARRIAWGQLVAGAVIGGIAVWSIALHLTDTTPSAMLAGVAATYQAWRDWLLSPLLAPFDIALSPLNRDILTFDAVMAAAWVRTALRYPDAWDGLIGFVLWPSLATMFIYLFAPDLWSPSFGVAYWISVAAAICAISLLLRPMTGVAASWLVDETTAAHFGSLTSPVALSGLSNALAVLVFAGGLFALDWAMRVAS